jgi:hypothetical protein
MTIPLLAGCSAYEKNATDAFVTELSDGSFEIEVRFYGRLYNAHNFSLFPSGYRGASWLYVKALTGIVPASEVIVTSEKSKLTGYAADRFQKGSVSFSSDTVTVMLENGQYRSMYGHNGQFRLKFSEPKKPKR